MAAHADNNTRRSGGVLSGQGVGIALAAIFVGVALAVAYIASDGALFAQPSSQLPGDAGQKQGTANHTPSTSSEARVISRDAFDKEPINAVKPPLQPQQERTSTAASNTKQELLAIKNFQWSSVAGQYVKDSQARFTSLKQLQPPLQEKEPLVLPDSIPMNVEPKGKTPTIDSDQSIFDALGDTTDPIEIPPIEDEEDDDKESTQDQQNDNDGNERQTDNQQNDANNGDSDSGDSSNDEPSDGSDDNSSSGSTSGDSQSGESNNEVPPTNSTDSSSSNSTESSSTSESDDDIGIELNLPL
jgi:hypothetical protein